MSHRITRLQPDTNYALRTAAISDSGKGEWSDSVTFSTTPIHPEAVAGLSLKQVESRTLKLEWEGSRYSLPLTYEAQYRSVSSNQEFQQVSFLHTVSSHVLHELSLLRHLGLKM